MSKKHVAIILLIPPLIWLISSFLIYKVFPDWNTRGLFGDMFGSVNAFFSSLALIGIVLSIVLQRKEFDITVQSMTKQLYEMEKSRSLSSTPLPIVNFKKCFIEQPRLFYSPPDKKHEVLSRYFFQYKIINKSDCVAADISTQAQLILNGKKDKKIFDCTGNHILVLSSSEIYPKNKDIDFMFVNDEDSDFFECIRSGKLPTLNIRLLYKNIQGGLFCVTQFYKIDVQNKESDEILKKWHSLISSFSIFYKNEVEALVKYKKQNDTNNWKPLFNEVKDKIIDYTKNDVLDLICHEVPGSFDVKVLTNDEYEKEISTCSFGRKIPVLSTRCV